MVMKTSLYLICAFVLLSTDRCQREGYPVDASGFTYWGKLINNGNFFRNGFYYYVSQSDDPSVSFCFFFEDGTFFKGSIDKVLFYSESTKCPLIKGRDRPWDWGLYIYQDSILKIQKVNPHRSWPGKFEVDEMWATIVNDSTLHFFKYISTAKKEQAMDVTYHFRPCYNKPDSTNVLMKYFE